MLRALALGFLASVLPAVPVANGLTFLGVVPAVPLLEGGPLDPLLDRAKPSLFNISLNIRSERDVSRRWAVGAASNVADGSMVVILSSEEGRNGQESGVYI
jgi:hypothetical protein